MKRKRDCVRLHKLRERLMYLVAPPCWRQRMEQSVVASLIQGHIDAVERDDISMMDQYQTALSKMGIRVESTAEDD